MSGGAPETPQLALDLRLADSASFSNFLPARNRELVDCLRRAGEGPGRGPGDTGFVYFWGGAGSGKTHLLQALCRQVQAQGESCAYVPLAQAPRMAPRVLEQLEQMAAVCIDDVHRIAGDGDWQSALFGLGERCRQRHTLLVIAGNAPPGDLGLTLPDLASRLQGWGLVYPLRALDDREKALAMQRRARNRGLELSQAVIDYVLKRYSRDMRALFGLLDRLDDASLTEQRRITIPFLRRLEEQARRRGRGAAPGPGRDR